MNLSTSGSDQTKPNRKRQTWWMRGLIWALLLLVLSEIFIFRNPAIYGAIPASSVGQITDLEKRLARQDRAKIKMVIFGDSQSMDALRPPMLAKRYGLKPDEMFNLSVSGGKPVDMLRLYEKVMDTLPNVKYAILAVNEHQLNNRNYLDDTKFRYNATLLERLETPGFTNKADLAFGWLLYSYGMRGVWTQMLPLYLKGQLPQPPDDHYAYRWGLPPVEKIERNHIGPAYSKVVADRWMANYQVEGPQTTAFEKVLAGLSSRGIKWTILQLPRTPEFERLMKETYGPQQKAFRDLEARLAQQYGEKFVVIPPVLGDEYFRDANHVNKRGAERVAGYVPGI
ncbi:hypothetical protein [Aneurinibacillus terranovensis]|uniref:hypothetical protein n=1 Tax=Aneurinibacillus terranovensis TaxID=278991 RepID=UPI00041D3BEC|nr:hypothetical protein [Aneurinibacillus terranovensis]